MNILQVLPELKSGGVETGTVDLARELTGQGHKAVVISNGGRLVKDLTSCGGIHYTLPVHEKSPIAIISMINKIKEVIKKENIDLVHARSRVPAFSAFFASYQMRVPFITTCHGYYSTHPFSRVMGWGRFVIVSSNVIARHMIKDFGVPRQRIRLIPRGVNLEKFPYRPPDTSGTKKEHRIGVIGRITPIKGHVYLIRAITRVARLLPHIKVLIIGDAPPKKAKYRQELEVLVRRLSLSKYLHFLGERQDIPQQLAKLDLVVVPSIGEEAFGRVIIEAQACGIPVIATRVGGIVDIVKDGENGILVQPRDWNELSDAIIRLLKGKDLRQRLSRAGRINVEKNFSLSHMYKKTIKVYNEALSSFRILIIKWGALGDIILSLPALKAVKMRFPKTDIIMVTSKAGRELLSRYPYVKEFLIFKHKKGFEGVKEILDLSAELKRTSVDLVLDLQNNRRSHIISFLSFAPRRIGYRNRKFDFLLNEAIGGARMDIPPVAHQFRLLKLLGIDSIPTTPQFTVSEREKAFAEDMLAESWLGKGQALVGLNCGASRRWQTKRWPTEKLAKLCDMLAQKRVRVVITGAKDDMTETNRLVLLTKSKPINAVGKTTIMQLAAVIQRCKVFITSDSAPMHLAAFLGVPFVALFGPTDPRRHLQAYNAKYRIIYKRLKCSPCYRPRCSSIRCMEKVSSEEVATAVLELLKENG